MPHNISFNVNEGGTVSVTQQPEFELQQQQQLIQQVFGYRNVNSYSIDQEELRNVGTDMDEGKTALLGYPVFMPLLLQKTQYDTMVNGQKRADPIVVQQLFLPTILIEASRSKLIEATTIEGRNGTIKEFSNMGDYEVSIKGILVGDEGNYPRKQVQALAEFENCPVAISISNSFLQYINVSKLVIKRISWRNMQGYQNLQAFELDCISDDEVNQKIKL